MKTRKWVLIAILAGWLVPAAQATTLVRMSLEQLSQAASTVVRARVLSQESGWNPEHTRIQTVTTLEVSQALKGHPPSTVQVVQPGGTVGNFHVRVAGSVFLRPQAEYVLFLEPAGSQPSRYIPVGMAQGAFRIYRDATTHDERVILPAGALFRAAPAGGEEVFAARDTVPLKEFQKLVSNTVRAPLAIPRGMSIPVVIDSTQSEGVGRLDVYAHTTADLFPNAGVVIPAGSAVEGTASLMAGSWKIRWTDVSVRGSRAQISGVNSEPEGSLRGRLLLIKVR